MHPALARPIADHAGRSGIPGTHLPLAFTFENGVPAVPYPRQKIRYRHHVAARGSAREVGLPCDRLGAVEAGLRQEPSARKFSGRLGTSQRHQQVMFAVRTEGMKRHRLRVAAEVWWFANHGHSADSKAGRWRAPGGAGAGLAQKRPQDRRRPGCGNASQRRRSI